MKPIVALHFSFVFLGILIWSCQKSNSPTGNIKVTIHALDGVPVTDVTLSLDSGYIQKTDISGTFVYSGLLPQKYILRATKQGYKNFSKTIVLIDGQTQDILINLTPFTPTLSVTPNSFSVKNQSDSIRIPVSANIKWDAESIDINWLRCRLIKKKADTTITISWTANISSSKRTGSIVITGEYSQQQLITITQDLGATPFLTADLKNLGVGTDGGQTYFGVNSNVAWTVSCNGDYWLWTKTQRGMNDGLVFIEWTQNTVAQPQVATLTITGEGGVSQKVTITQESWIQPIICHPCGW